MVINMKLYELVSDICADVRIPNREREVDLVTDSSRSVITDGTVFVCIKGGSFDGHSFAAEMLSKGAAAVVCEHSMGLENEIIVKSTRTAYGILCARLFGNPEKKLELAAVTGTNGKTTITTLISSILTACGRKTGLIGTIRSEIDGRAIPDSGGNTTPFAYDFFKLLNLMVSEGCTNAVMEASSFGLVQERMGEARFKVGVFTNLTQDHLDYHGDMESYYQAKKLLFMGKCDVALINTDDAYGRRLYDEIDCEKYSYGIENADFTAANIKIKPDGLGFWLCHGGKSYQISAHLTGVFNVLNLMAAVITCIKLGLPTDEVIAAAADCTGVKGRCEIIPTGRDFTVICDYAHTPDALENILSNVRTLTKGRLICLFGCGGNRDAKKRPLMAAAVQKYADVLIVTSDNPRNENPDDIIDMIIGGLDSKTKFDRITDRRDAIYHALKIAQAGDVIVLAGKGHEDYQILADGVHIHFDEREVVADGLKLL